MLCPRVWAIPQGRCTAASSLITLIIFQSAQLPFSHLLCPRKQYLLSIAECFSIGRKVPEITLRMNRMLTFQNLGENLASHVAALMAWISPLRSSQQHKHREKLPTPETQQLLAAP